MRPDRFSRLLVFCFGAFAAVVACAQQPPSFAWRPIDLVVERVPFSTSDAARPESAHRIGQAWFRAGFAVRSQDVEFGGFSGMLIDDGRLLAVSDQGHWWTATLVHDADGLLVGLTDGRMAPLADVDGTQVSDRMRRDAEELARGKDSVVVAFEGDHRTQIYRQPGDPSPRIGPAPEGISEAGDNSGMEALTGLADGRLMVLTEDLRDAAGNLRGWVSDPTITTWQPFAVATEEGFMATAAATLPSGELLLLQRFYKPEIGVRVQLLKLAQADIDASLAEGSVVVGQELARFQPPLSVDNFEALDVEVGPQGRLFAYLLTDDNYSDQQRTLLFQLELSAAD